MFTPHGRLNRHSRKTFPPASLPFHLPFMSGFEAIPFEVSTVKFPPLCIFDTDSIGTVSEITNIECGLAPEKFAVIS